MSFSSKFLEQVKDIALSLDTEKIEEMVECLHSVRNEGGRLFVLGVGGSAANASHAVNDFRKLAGIESYAPTDNVSEITARTNDEGFETIFESFLQTSKLNARDSVLILSVGGGDYDRRISVNLCKAIDFAKSVDARCLAIVGKPGGYAHLNSEICLVIPKVDESHITPHSEAFQAIVWHLMVSHPKLKLNSTTW